MQIGTGSPYQVPEEETHLHPKNILRNLKKNI